MRYLLLILCFVFSFTVSSFSQSVNEAQAFVSGNINGIIKVLYDDTVSRDVKIWSIKNQLSPVFDFRLITKLTVGKVYWPKLSPEQRKKLVDRFGEYLKDFYVQQMLSYTDERFEYPDPWSKKRKVFIPVDIVQGSDRVQTLYKLYQAKSKDGTKQWRVYDLEIEGVSVIATYQQQFKPYFEDQDFDGLIETLK